MPVDNEQSTATQEGTTNADAVIQKLNSTYQQDLKVEIESFNYFIN